MGKRIAKVVMVAGIILAFAGLMLMLWMPALAGWDASLDTYPLALAMTWTGLLAGAIGGWFAA